MVNMNLYMLKSKHGRKKKAVRKKRAGMTLKGKLKKGYRFNGSGRVVKARKRT